MSLLFICFASCLLGSSRSFVLQRQKEIQKRINPLEVQGAVYFKGIEGMVRVSRGGNYYKLSLNFDSQCLFLLFSVGRRL